MNKAIEELKAAYDAVFNEDGTMKTCGRKACINLISLMMEHSSEDVGNLDTGMINPEVMKSEYERVISENP
jgi:hypothetical protein